MAYFLIKNNYYIIPYFSQNFVLQTTRDFLGQTVELRLRLCLNLQNKSPDKLHQRMGTIFFSNFVYNYLFNGYILFVIIFEKLLWIFWITMTIVLNSYPYHLDYGHSHALQLPSFQVPTLIKCFLITTTKCLRLP